MNTYNQYKKEVGKDAIKAVAFFFIGVPAFFAAIGLYATYGLKFLLPATLGLAGVLWLIKKARAAKPA